MDTGLRVVIASYGPLQFRLLHESVMAAGHVPVAYIVSRSMRSSAPAEPELLDATRAIVAGMPPGMDLLLPGGVGTMASMLAGYKPDILLVFGFNWRLSREVLELPRLGALNVHPSALPKYRGPSPILWAIRNGDASMGMTVHRMTDDIDAGPVLAQASGLPIPDQVTSEDIWELTKAALPGLLAEALERAMHGDPGVPQDEARVIRAGFPPSGWYTVSWRGLRRDVHNQLRVLRYMYAGPGPVLEYQGSRLQVERTSLTEDGGTRIECADGPVWVTFTPPVRTAEPG